MSIKLGKRLQQLDVMVADDYQHIWDCCCDHGLLGFTLLARLEHSCIHFVDIVPELMRNIDDKLAQHFAHLPSTRAKTYCIDVATLPLSDVDMSDDEHSDKTNNKAKHLVIIAGVGGDLMVSFIDAIIKAHPDKAIDFLLCPVHHQFSLRSKLIELDFSLQDECLIAENNRFYEVLLVSSISDEQRKVSVVGDKIWQSDTVEQANITKAYLTKTLEHYQRIARGKDSDVQAIIAAYDAVVMQ